MAEETGSQAATIIRSAQGEILARWEERVRTMQPAANVPRVLLRDSVPLVVSSIADDIERTRGVEVPEPVPTEHAVSRLRFGYDLSQVVVEYAVLRDVVFETLRRHGVSPSHDEIRSIDGFVDRALVATVRVFAEFRERMLTSLDRIATEGIGLRDVDALLEKLIRSFVTTTPSIDTCAILLREGERLRVRATLGLDEDLHRGFVVGIGKGFSGTIAATREPLLLTEGSASPQLESAALRSRGLRVLYGVPLVERGELLGVAHMGSTSADTFAEEEMLLFRALAARASGLLAQARLVQELELEQQVQRRTMAIVGHDLRNPLSAIMVGAQILAADEALPERASLIAHRILRSGTRMRELIDVVLDAARVRSGGIEIQRREADMVAIVRETVEELAMAHPDRTIDVVSPPNLTVMVDPPRIKQLLSNLIGNAIKHGRAGAAITVRVQQAEDAVELEVENQGEPIPPDDMEDIFLPFRTKSQSTGLGLGLYIANDIVRSHGGNIGVRSSATEGTTFTVRLPLH